MSLNVVNGDSVAHTLRRARAGESVIVWRDVLNEGPDPSAGGEALIAALDAGTEVVLWFEHDLTDQLQLIEILARIAAHPERGSVRLISLDAFPGHPRFLGLGELDAAELGSLWPRRRPIAAETFAAAARAYEALRRGDPAALAELVQAPLPGLPYLAAALTRLLEDPPWCGPGPGRSERQIVRAVAEGARTPTDVFLATQAMEEVPFAGDSWIFDRVRALVARGVLVSTADGLEASGRSDP